MSAWGNAWANAWGSAWGAVGAPAEDPFPLPSGPDAASTDFDEDEMLNIAMAIIVSGALEGTHA